MLQKPSYLGVSKTVKYRKRVRIEPAESEREKGSQKKYGSQTKYSDKHFQ